MTPRNTPTTADTHIVQFYQDEEYLAESVAAFLMEGLQAEQALVIFATAAHRAAFSERLALRGVNVAQACAAGTITFVDAHAALEGCIGEDGMPDPIRFDATVAQTLEQVRQARPGRVRAYGELVDLLVRAGSPAAAVRLEELWNDLAGRISVSLLCTYAMSAFPADAQAKDLRAICGQHDVVLPTESFTQLNDTQRGPEVALLQQRAQALEMEVANRRRLEAALRDALARSQRAERATLQLAAIVASSDDAIVAKDLDGTITSWNRAAERMFGYTAEEAVGRPIRIIIPADRQSEADDVLARVARGESVEHFETVRRRKDGTHVSISLSVSPVRDGSGRIVGASKIARDITDRKLAEAERELLLRRAQAAREEAERANRMKDEFLAIVSHELRTPLNAILGWTQVSNAASDEGTLRRAIDVIGRNAKSQSHLIDDLLDVSRIISGKVTLAEEIVDLSSVLAGAIESVRPAAAEREVTLAASMDARGVWIRGDGARLQQILWNLLSNAIKFTPAGGRVDVRLDGDAQQAQIVVQDTGQGIAAEFLPHVFDRFSQADTTTTRLHGGLGLGLAVVSHLAGAHGGTVTAASAGAGLGATFTVTFPVAPAPAGHEGTGLAGGEPVALHGVRVLVVDDHADARELMRTMLEAHGAAVTLAEGAGSAAQALAGARFDVLVSDVGMPGVDGFALLSGLRRRGEEHVRDVPAIAVSAYAGDAARGKALAAGFDQYLTKPLDAVRLASAVSAVTRMRRISNADHADGLETRNTRI